MDNTTAIIINFLREPYLYECLRSLKEKYPDIQVLVGENGEYTKEKKKKIEAFKNVKYIEVEYDAGVCKARNLLVSLVKTKYILIGDDDFKYYEKSEIDKMEDFLDEHKEFDLIGGRTVEGGAIKNYQGFIHQYDDHFKYEALDLKENTFNKCDKTGLLYKPCDLTFNFFIARTEAVKDTLWEEKIKVAYEHSTFFIDFIRKGHRVAFTPDILVIHKPILEEKIEDIGNYLNYRYRKSDKKTFFKRFNISSVIDMDGRRDFYDETEMGDITFCITMFERWEKLEILLFSIAQYYPTAKILIADQSKKFIAKKYKELYEKLYEKGLKNKPTAYNMPYDCGLSVCRNKLVGLAKTDYVLILEEDFVLTEKTKVKKMLKILENNQEYIGVGGQVYENESKLNFSFFYKKSNFSKTIKMIQNTNDYNDEGFRETEGILNFCLFKRNIFRTIVWDNDIKVSGEHTDFLLKLKDKGLKIVETTESRVDHNKTPETREYKNMRLRDEFLKIMFNKNKFNKLIYPSGFTIILNDGIIKKGRGI